MNLAIAAAVFPVIFIGELPDKTMVASALLSTRGRAGAVWLGAAAAFVIHVGIATTAGVLAFRLLPTRVIRSAVAVVFLAGAAFAASEAWRSRRGATDDEPASEIRARGPGRPGGPASPARRAFPAPARTAGAAFAVIFAAEWGDLTQMLTVNLAAHYHSPMSVAAGAVLALWSVAALAVAGGRKLTSLVSAFALHAGTAVLLAGLAAYAAWAALA